MPFNLQGIVFDLDGVLIRGSNEGYFDCHAFALSQVGIDLPRSEQRKRLLEFWSYPHEFQLGLFISDPAQLSEASRAYEEFLFSDRFFSRVEPIEGATQIVTQLAAHGIPLSVATGMHTRQVPIALRLLGIDSNVFVSIMSGYEIEDDRHQKPDPFMLNTLLERMHVRNTDAIYVGDSKDDVRMARAAGVTSVAVLTGNMTESEAREERSDYILLSVTDLPQLPFLENILGRGSQRRSSEA
jgi:HAD superfamily hydrolase (TIGR01549 family)